MFIGRLGVTSGELESDIGRPLEAGLDEYGEKSHVDTATGARYFMDGGQCYAMQMESKLLLPKQEGVTSKGELEACWAGVAYRWAAYEEVFYSFQFEDCTISLDCAADDYYSVGSGSLA